MFKSDALPDLKNLDLLNFLTKNLGGFVYKRESPTILNKLVSPSLKISGFFVTSINNLEKTRISFLPEKHL